MRATVTVAMQNEHESNEALQMQQAMMESNIDQLVCVCVCVCVYVCTYVLCVCVCVCVYFKPIILL